MVSNILFFTKNHWNCIRTCVNFVNVSPLTLDRNKLQRFALRSVWIYRIAGCHMGLSILFDTVKELRENITREGCMLEGTLYVFSLVLSL
jgi:hypothetical protein